MASAKAKGRSFQDVELDLLRSLQSTESPFVNFLAHATHHTIRDGVLLFSVAVIYLALESPTFGFTLLVTLCLTELLNGIIKLYSVRPRPLWISTALRRKGPAWEKDSSFPSSHAQTIATVFACILFEEKSELSLSTWRASLYVSALITFLAGLSRVYLAMHFVSDVVFGWLLGFMVAFFVHQTSFISTLARLPTSYSIGISIFSTAYILGVIILASHGGQTDLNPQQVEKWLQTAKSNQSSSARSKNDTAETIRPHDILPYQLHLGIYFGTTVSSALFPHIFHAQMPIASPRHHPHSYYSQAPTFMRLLIGIGGLVALDSLKSLIFKRQKRLLWPEWRQCAFEFIFYSFFSAWLVLGTDLVCVWGWPLKTAAF